MHRFRVQLILALIASVTLVSVASTYFEVLRHRHVLRQELQARTHWMGVSLEPNLEAALAAGNTAALPGLADSLRAGTGSLGLAISDPHGHLLASSGPAGSAAFAFQKPDPKELAKGRGRKRLQPYAATGNGCRSRFRSTRARNLPAP